MPLAHPPTTQDVASASESASSKRQPTLSRFKRQDYDEYDNTMKTLGIGIPILKPCPSSLTNSANIGDVGYMKDGEFCRLFSLEKRPAVQPETYLFQGKEGDGMAAIVSDPAISVVFNEVANQYATHCRSLNMPLISAGKHMQLLFPPV